MFTLGDQSSDQVWMQWPHFELCLQKLANTGYNFLQLFTRSHHFKILPYLPYLEAPIKPLVATNILTYAKLSNESWHNVECGPIVAPLVWIDTSQGSLNALILEVVAIIVFHSQKEPFTDFIENRHLFIAKMLPWIIEMYTCYAKDWHNP